MTSSTELNRRAGAGRGGEIALVVVIAVGATLLLGILVVSFILIRRRRRRAHGIPYHVSAPPIRSHSQNISDGSVNPLLMHETKDDWDFKEKFVAPTRRSTEESHGYRDILSNNPAGLYHIPSSHTPPPTAVFSPAASSFCLHELDTKSIADHPYRTAAIDRPPLPPLPSLVIPQNRLMDWYSHSQVPTTVTEEQSPSRPPSSCPSSVSLYSQTTAESPSGSPPRYLPIPLPQETAGGLVTTDDGLKRNDTHLVGNLLKARAQRNPDGLVRASSQVSHIERTGSIKSILPINEDDRPYAKRYRLKKKRSRPTANMGVVEEGSERASFRSRSDSSTFDPGLLIQPPLPALTSTHTPLGSKPQHQNH